MGKAEGNKRAKTPREDSSGTGLMRTPPAPAPAPGHSQAEAPVWKFPPRIWNLKHPLLLHGSGWYLTDNNSLACRLSTMDHSRNSFRRSQFCNRDQVPRWFAPSTQGNFVRHGPCLRLGSFLPAPPAFTGISRSQNNPITC